MNISEVIAAIKAGPNDITLYSGAEQHLIDEFEKQVGFELPADLKVFYQFCNGFESAEDLFRIIPLNEALETRSRDMAEYYLKSNQFYLAEYLIYCDIWTIEIDLNQPNVYKISSGNGSWESEMLTCSFAEFLMRFLKGGLYGNDGLYKWEKKSEGGNLPHC